MATTIQDLPLSLQSALFNTRTSQINLCCLYALVIWDWLICLPQERELVWRRGRSAMNIAYYLCRYFPLFCGPVLLWPVVFSTHSERDCPRITRVGFTISTINQTLTEIVLLIRTYAFLGSRRRTLILLSTYLAIAASSLIALFHALFIVIPFVDPFSTTGPCYPGVAKGSPGGFIYFLIRVITDVLFTGLCGWKAFRIRNRGGGHNRLLWVFMQEGMLYFFIITTVHVVNAGLYFQPKTSLSYVGLALPSMLPNIIACRLVLDLRDRGNNLEVKLSGLFSRTATLSLHHRKTSLDVDGLRSNAPRGGADTHIPQDMRIEVFT